VQISLRSALAVVFALAGTILVLEIAQDALRAIAWVLMAMAIAALVYPLVDALARLPYVPRGVAVLVVTVVALGAIGFLGYRIVDDVTAGMEALRKEAPRRAAELERENDFFQEIKLRDRTQRFVDAIPERFAGGDAQEVIRSTATRGLATVAGIILTIFFVLYGARIVDGAFTLVHDQDLRRRTETVVRRSSARALFFARVMLAEAVVEGFAAYLVARAAGVPGAAALAVWVALWSLLPVAGVLIGATPIVIFAAAVSPGTAVLVALAFAAMASLEVVANRWMNRRMLFVGSFVVLVTAFAGVELYGLSGALLFMLGGIFAVAIAAEVTDEEEAEKRGEVGEEPPAGGGPAPVPGG